jgi:hypothetical protein
VPLDESLAFYWASLALSAAGVVLFLWLVRIPGTDRGAAGASGTKPAPDGEKPLE